MLRTQTENRENSPPELQESASESTPKLGRGLVSPFLNRAPRGASVWGARWDATPFCFRHGSALLEKIMAFHLLCCDDQVSLTTALAYMLQKTAWRVSVTNDPMEAVAMIQKGDVDGFLVDYLMPRYNGLEVIERLRASHPSLPVILMTGFLWEVSRDQVKRLGVLEVLEKPVVLQSLLKALPYNLEVEYVFEEAFLTPLQGHARQRRRLTA